MDKVKQFIQNQYHYIIAIVLYLPFLFMGYGSDSDTYSVLWTGEKFASTFDYIPSRPPGFLVFETIVFFLNKLGKSILTNLFVLFMFFVFVYCFIKILKGYEISNQKVLVLAVVAHPIVWIEATSTMDFFVALGFIWLGFYLLTENRWWGAGLALALGIGSRATSVLFVGCILAFLLWINPREWKKILGAAIIAFILSVVFYLPSLDFSKWTLRFLRPAVGGEEYWTPILRFGRWGYKSIFFWGIPVWILFGLGLYQWIKKFEFYRKSDQYRLIIFCLVGIAVYEAFYIFIPTEPAYLMPTIPLWLILMGVFFKSRPKLLWLIVGFLFLSNFVSINFAKPNDKNHATSVAYGVWVDKGLLIVETEERLRYVACGYQMCPEDLSSPDKKSK